MLQNEWTEINYWKICFALFLSSRLSLNVKFVHIKSLRYSACQLRNYSMMQEWHPIYPLYLPNQTKLMINGNVNKISNELAHLILFSNEGSCESVKVCH